MELATYVESLRRDLAAAAAPAGADTVRAAELLGTALEASARMGLLEALSDAAAEITTRLSNASVEVRLRGREAQFVVTETEPTPPVEDMTSSVTSQASPVEAEPGDIARVTLRLPEGLKEAVERAAAMESISVNAWLVRAITVVLSGPPPFPPPPPPPGRGRPGRRLTGWAQA